MHAPGSGNILLYNGVAFSAVHSRNSIVIPYRTDEVWRVVGNFGKQALWMGEVEGQHIFTQLLGGIEQDYVGACRVFGISDKLIFEQLTRLDDEEMVMCWQGIAHPKNSNPFPASFLNFKASLRLAPVLIPGRQTFIDWTMDFMTETHAVAYMRESMVSIMRVSLLNLQKFMATGSMPSHSLEMATRPPASYGIATMPQPVSAPVLLYHHAQTNLAGSQGLRQASATYMPPPVQQTAPIFSSHRIDRTVERLEPTVPLLHEAHPATQLLATAVHEAHVLAAKSSPILRPAHRGGYAVGEYPRRVSSSGGSAGSAVAGDLPLRGGKSLPELPSPPGLAAGSAHGLTVSAAGYPAHLLSTGTLLPGGSVGVGSSAVATEQGSSSVGSPRAQPPQQAQQPGAQLQYLVPVQQRELSLQDADFANSQGLAHTGGGSMPVQPSQSSIRALLAAQSASASKHNSAGGADTGSSFPGFRPQPPLPVAAPEAVPRIDSGASLDSLSLAEVGRPSRRQQPRNP